MHDTPPPRYMADILPPHATQFERVLAMQAEELLKVNVPIRELWNPQTCPEPLLLYLGWALSVDIFDNTWPVEKKRHVIAQAIHDHRIKGTYESHRRYISYVDGHLIQATTPPQSFFAAADTDGPEWNKWLRGLPEIRIEPVVTSGLAHNLLTGGGETDLPADAFSASEGADPNSTLDDDATWFAGPSISYDERMVGTLHRNGRSTPITVTTRPDPRKGKKGSVYDILISGSAGSGLFCDDADSVDFFLDGAPIPPSITVKFQEGSQEDEEWNLVINKTDKVQDVSPVRVPLNVNLTEQVFADQAFEESFLDAEDAERNSYYSLRLLEDGIKTPDASFLNADRFSMPPFTAELLVDLREPSVNAGFYASAAYLGETYALPEADLSKLWNACDASHAAKSLRDTILFDLDLPSKKHFKTRQSLKDLVL